MQNNTNNRLRDPETGEYRTGGRPEPVIQVANVHGYIFVTNLQEIYNNGDHFLGNIITWQNNANLTNLNYYLHNRDPESGEGPRNGPPRNEQNERNEQNARQR